MTILDDGEQSVHPRLKALQDERLSGMPRWNITGSVESETSDITASRRAVLAALARERPKNSYRHLRAA